MKPEFVFSDYSKFDRPPMLHLAFQTLDVFRKNLGRFPVAGSVRDVDHFIAMAVDITKEKLSDVDKIDEELLRHFANGSRAVLNPMAAMFGGVVGQEVVKACSGKFHPLFQVRL